MSTKLTTRILQFVSIVAIFALTLGCAPQMVLTPAPTKPATSTTLPTNTLNPTSTNTLVPPTATVEPDPGVSELKKISELILDGGAVEYFGRFAEHEHPADGAGHYSQSSCVMTVTKKDGAFEIWFGESYLLHMFPDGATYDEYTFDCSKVNIAEAKKEMEYVLRANAKDLAPHAPKGFSVVASVQGIESQPVQMLTVTVDYKHDVLPSTKVHFPAMQYGKLTTGEKLTFTGGYIIAFTCIGSKTQIVAVGFTTFTSPCPMAERYSLQNVYYNAGTETQPVARQGTAPENAKLMKYLLSQLDNMTTKYAHAYYYDGTYQLGDVMPFSSFPVSTEVVPVSSGTPGVTPTRTAQPTYTPTINLTVVGTVTASTGSATCTNSDQSVVYTVTGPMLGAPVCQGKLTYQDPAVDSLVIHGDQGLLVITLDRGKGPGKMYATVIINAPDYGTPDYTLSGTSIVDPHPTKTAQNQDLLAIQDNQPVTMTLTIGEFTITATAH